MKEQWKKHDSDAKLLQNVEEGRSQPIKIELPISAFALKQESCCNRLITLLRIAILFVLLIILSWTAVTLYSSYYPRQLEIDEKAEQLVSNQHDYSSEENKISFRNKVYAMSDMKDNVGSNEIDTPIEASTAASITTWSKDSGFDDEKVRSILEFLQTKNAGGIRVIDIIPKQENNIINELQIIEDGRATLEGKLNLEPNLEPYPANQNEFINTPDVPIFNVEGVREAMFENKEDNSHVNNEVYDKMFNAPDKELDTEKKDSYEETAKAYILEEIENKGDEVVIPSFEDVDTPQFVQNFESDMEIEDADDVEELFHGIANAMGLLDEPSSEINQSNEESVAVIQEEIKNNEENLENVDLGKVISAEEQSTEESVKHEEMIGPSAEAEPIMGYAVVIKEEVPNKSEESTEEKNLNGQHTFPSTVDMLRSILSSTKTESSSSMEFITLDNIQSAAAILANVLEPLVGESYELVHWYYSTLLNASFGYLFYDQKLVYAAKVLYNQNIGEYDTDMQMFLNEITKNDYLKFPDLMDPQKQVLADTFLQKQIVDKLVMKLYLKMHYDVNMITFDEAWEKIGESNSNHVKSWLIATHPSTLKKNLKIVSSMNYRRALYSFIKEDSLAVANELTNEDNDLSLLNFNDDDFDEEPTLSLYEKFLVLSTKSEHQLSDQEVDKPVENTSVDYVPDNENESINDEYLVQQFQQVIIDAMKEVGKEFDYSEEKFLETTEKLEGRMSEDSDSNDSALNEKSSEDNDSNDSASNEKSVSHLTINSKFIYFLSKKLEPIVGPYFKLIDWYHNNYDPNHELEETQDNLSAYTGKLLFETDIRNFYKTLNIVSRLVMSDSNAIEYEKIIADDLDLTPETDMQSYIFDILNQKLKLYNIWKNEGDAVLNDIIIHNAEIYHNLYQHYSDIAKHSFEIQTTEPEDVSFVSSAQSSSDEFIPKNQRIVQAMKEIGEEYEQTEESTEETMDSVFKHRDNNEESIEETTDSILNTHDNEQSVNVTGVSELKNHDSEESAEETEASVLNTHDNEQSVTVVSELKNHDSEESVEETTASVVNTQDNEQSVTVVSELKNHDTAESVEETTASILNTHDNEESVTVVSELKNHDAAESVEETTASVVKSRDDDADYGLEEEIDESKSTYTVRTLEEPVESIEEKEEERYPEPEEADTLEEDTLYDIDYY